MKTITMFETIDELLDGFKTTRPRGDSSPVIPQSVEIFVLSDGKMCFTGSGHTEFSMGDLFIQDLIDRCLELQGVRVCEEETNEQK